MKEQASEKQTEVSEDHVISEPEFNGDVNKLHRFIDFMLEKGIYRRDVEMDERGRIRKVRIIDIGSNSLVYWEDYAAKRKYFGPHEH